MDLKSTLIIRLIGVEPITFGTEIQRSIQLSYKRNRVKRMIQQETILKVADNSGAKTVRCIKILGGFKKKKVSLGDILVVSVQNLRNKSKKTSKVKKKEVYKALLIRVKTSQKTANGFRVYFQENAVTLLNKQGNPIGSRIAGPISKKLKKKKFNKFANISAGFI